MNFSSPSKILSVISKMQSAEILRASQRALLNGFYNGDPPYTAKEAEENKIGINFNDKAGSNILLQARGQWENAMLKTANFFKITVDCPAAHQSEYSAIVTKEINRVMKLSRSYIQTSRSGFAGVVLHGVGAGMWWDECGWQPSAVGIQELLIPTDTKLSMENLSYFSVQRQITPGQLFKLSLGKGKNMRPGWNSKVVRSILDHYKELNENSHNYDWANNPEQMAELYKQNLSYYEGDSAPSIALQDFWFKQGEEYGDKPGWYRTILLDKGNSYFTEMEQNGKDSSGALIYKSERPFCEKLDNIISFQFGDGNNVPPFKYHSIRSLAYMLYELLWTMNRLNCQLSQHVFEQLMVWFRVQDPADRDRLDKIHMQPPYGILPEGLSIVSAQERHTVEEGLINLLRADYKQKIGEASSAYTQKADDGTKKERTLGEVQAILSQVSSMMSTMLTNGYLQKKFEYSEIARRFCIENSSDWEVKKFQSACIAKGVPQKYLDIERWDLSVEQVLGGGNKAMELAQARELRGMRQTLNPNAQLEVDRIYVTALTDNPALGELLIPHVNPVSDAVHDAELAFGTLMQGIPVSIKEGLNHIEQAETIIKLMANVIKRIKTVDGVGTRQDVVGLSTAAQYANQHIAIIAQDENEKAMVKALGDALGRLMNEVKAFAQRQQEADKAKGQQPDPETIQKLQSQEAANQQKLKSKEQSHQQKLIQKKQSFESDQARKNAEAAAGIQRATGETLAEIQNVAMLEGSNTGDESGSD